MTENRLNLMSYYGGKANMSSMIADMLDYRYSKVYVELFGGAGSVLLNKIPHDIEIYNEYNLGIYTLFKVLKNKDTVTELIDRLHRSSEYSKDCFMDAMAYRNRLEDNPMVENTRLLFEYIKEIQFKHNIDWYNEYVSGKGIDINLKNLNLTPSEIRKGNMLMDVYYKLIEVHFPDIDQLLVELKGAVIPNFDNDQPFDLKPTDLKIVQINKYVRLLQQMLGTYTFKERAHQAYFVNLLAKISARYEKCFHAMSEDMKLREKGIRPEIEYDEIELAKSTYIIYQCSRDGIGKDFSHVKYKSNDNYLSHISNLYRVAERLENVIIVNRNAFECIKMENIIDIICKENNYLPDDFKESDICMYLDPPYLQEKPLSLEVLNTIAEYNPGLIYKTGSFTYEKHVEFVGAISEKGYNMVVSNYRDVTGLYDRYLHRDKGWSSLEYMTKTTVGNKAGNNRTEVLWYNY